MFVLVSAAVSSSTTTKSKPLHSSNVTDSTPMSACYDRRPVQTLTLLFVVIVIAVSLPIAVEGHRAATDHRHQTKPQSAAASTGKTGVGVSSSEHGFHDSKIVHDTEHINEHLQGKAAVNVSEMSLEELEFHYFKMHDFDNNTKLDGLEILKALTHLLPYENVDDADVKVDTRGKTTDEIGKEKSDKELIYYTEIVDNVLADDDIDDDGYLTYPEYIIARRREDAQEYEEEKSKSHAKSKKHT